MTEIDSILKDAQSVAVSGHVRPDGDCVGSTLAVYNYFTVYITYIIFMFIPV